MAQKVRVQLAAYDERNQKIEGTDRVFEVEQSELRLLAIPEGYTWPPQTQYLGFWLPDFSEMLIKIVPPTPEEAAEAGLLTEPVLQAPPEGGTTRVLRKGSSAEGGGQ